MFSAELDPRSFANFNRTLQRLADATDRPVEEVLRQQGRLLAKDLAFHIHPRGVSANIGKQFKDSILKKVLSIYRPVGWIHSEVWDVHGEAAADHIVKLIRTGKYQEARRKLEGPLRPRIQATFIAVGEFDGGRLHKQWRWRRSRRHPIMIVRNYRDAQAYAREAAAQAGLAKAALIKAGRDLDGKAPGIPQWITRHHTAPGRGRLIKSKAGFSGWIQSFVRYARQALPLSDEIRALDVRQSTAERQLKRVVDANIRRAMRGS